MARPRAFIIHHESAKNTSIVIRLHRLTLGRSDAQFIKPYVGLYDGGPCSVICLLSHTTIRRGDLGDWRFVYIPGIARMGGEIDPSGKCSATRSCSSLSSTLAIAYITNAIDQPPSDTVACFTFTVAYHNTRPCPTSTRTSHTSHTARTTRSARTETRRREGQGRTH